MIVPIMIYGSEIWGFENMKIIERLHLKFLKLICPLRNSTPNYNLYGEFGREPIYIRIYKRVIIFWHKLATYTGTTKMSSLLFDYMHSNAPDILIRFKWFSFVKKIIADCGLNEIYDNPTLCTSTWLGSTVERILKDQNLQNWRSSVEESSKGFYYRYYKQELIFEHYLYMPKSIYLPILRFRTSNHNLPVETGRWTNTPRNERTCTLCNSPAVGDELHYLFRCQALHQQRLMFLPKYIKPWSNIHTLITLFSSKKAKDIKKNLSKFITSLSLTVKS